ncbi:MAG: ornithine cyclodeaminase family protein [Pseudomonadota bacterium]
MKRFNSQQTRAALPFPRLIEALRAMFIEGCEVPQRHTHTLAPQGDTGGGTVLIMPAWQAGRYLGIKTVSIFPGNASQGLPALFSSYRLHDARTGEPLAEIDGNEITSRRTAAASALAGSMLARPDARQLLVVGAGRVGSLMAEAYQAVLPITEVQVWNPREAGALRLARSLGEQGVAAEATTDLADAVARADIVSCATLSREPLVQGGWLAEGSHLDLIGSFTPQMREADDACFAGASLYVDTLEAVQKSGDLLGPLERKVISAADVRATLQALCRGEHPGRSSASERTVFKSVGTALEDLAAAILVYESEPAEA